MFKKAVQAIAIICLILSVLTSVGFAIYSMYLVANHKFSCSFRLRSHRRRKDGYAIIDIKSGLKTEPIQVIS
jgi:hypothetical protein